MPFSFLHRSLFVVVFSLLFHRLFAYPSRSQPGAKITDQNTHLFPIFDSYRAHSAQNGHNDFERKWVSLACFFLVVLEKVWRMRGCIHRLFSTELSRLFNSSYSSRYFHSPTISFGFSSHFLTSILWSFHSPALTLSDFFCATLSWFVSCLFFLSS